MTKVLCFITIPEAIQKSKFLNATANITKTVSKKAYNITIKIGKVSVAFGTEAIEGITDASIDVLGGENRNETTKDILNSTLEKMGRGGHININPTAVGISSAILIKRGLKAVPFIISNGCLNLLY